MSTLIIHNANILSFHNGFKQGSADTIVVDKNKITATGRYDDLKNLAHFNTVRIDAAGRMVMPGFNDSHIHIWKVQS